MSGSNLVPTLEQLAQFVREAARDEPLDQVARAAELQVHLADLSDQLVGHFINEARRAAHSWTAIGDVLGVSKQAAYQRHQTRSAYYRFSEEAQLGFEAAQHQAKQLRHNYVGTEHLLLGMLAEPRTIAGRTLPQLGVSLEALRSRVIELEGEGNRDLFLAPTTLTPRAKKILDLALRTSFASGYKNVYSPHIVLAFLDAKEGIAGELLKEAHIAIEALESSLLPLMPDPREEEQDEKERTMALTEDQLQQHLADARQQPKIAASEMLETIVKARQGDKGARQALVKHYLAKAAALALDHRPSHLAQIDAVAEANGILLQMAADPPTEDFEISLERKVRVRMEERRTQR
ncbi:MAG: Clp protease N-terminal domain-containing protein [Actinomycetota bacterium]|nr:hypothetical protein [Actinomycetota bacterium]